ncbi:MAG TPA: MG2 domain-containing protein [Polyangiaceae bacterium]|nr:MG2 domain-containing protein [Polyangiaceae bacterium]
MRQSYLGLRSLRSLHFRSAPFALLLAASFAAAVACGSSSKHPTSTVVMSGAGDRSENGVVSVDETKLRGTIEDGTLSVDIPVKSLVTERARGNLKLHLTSVDGKDELGSVDVPYELDAEESATLSASLAAPKQLAEQQDLVSYSVRLDDGAQDGLRVTRSLMYVVPLVDLSVEGPSTLRPLRNAYYRVRVQNQLEGAPVEGQAVTFELMENDAVVQTQDVETEATGDAQVQLQVDHAGDFKVRARIASNATKTKLEDSVHADAGLGKLLLTSDKPIYQPGQRIYLRALSLARDGNKPMAGQEATFEVEDAKGNKVLKKVIRSDKFGVAATDFLLGNIVNEGTYKLRVVSSEVTSEKTVNVSHYALPKFDVAVKTEDPWYAPGSEIKGAIDSKYFFGKPVTGSVTVEAYSIDVGTTLFQQTMGTLSADGHYDFSLMLPATLPGTPLEQGNAAIELRVTVTDSAGQKVEKSQLVTVSAQGANVALVPESGALVPGIENQLLLFATDPLGSPLANAEVQLTVGDDAPLSATTDDYGQASIAYTPPIKSAAMSHFQAVVTLDGGKTVASTFDFAAQTGAEHLLLRTDKSVYQLGETVKVDITSTEAKGTVYVDWINGGQTVDMRTLTAESGAASFSTTVDPSLAGSNRIEAYLVDDDGQIVRTGRTIFARNDAALNIAVSTDQDVYTPGAPAKLKLSVTDETGAPAVAALGLQIVDQAVFSLVDAKPGLLRTYFEIEDQLAKPTYELHAPAADFSSLLFQDTAQKNKAASHAAQMKTSAALAAMKNTSLTGIQHDALTEILAAARGLLQPAYDALQKDLSPVIAQATENAVANLKARGCEPYSACGTSNFFTELKSELEPNVTVYDFWGNRFEPSVDYTALTLKGAGADEKLGTSDDASLVFQLPQLSKNLEIDLSGGFDNGAPQATGGTASAGFPGGAGASAGGSTSTSGDDAGPRVRRDFPETLYVNPSVITKADGTATIDLNMADSITEWRVSALANSSDGRLGGSDSGIKVFQDFFVDVSFPAALTRGDEVTFPIAVYNYLDTPQTVDLELQAGSWYTALGGTTTSVDLQPGQVLGVSFPVKVNDVGLQTLTVIAKGSKKSDAVARSVRVVPDGKAFPAALSGSLDTPSALHSVSFPANEVPGSQQLYLDIFPSFLSQAVQGMDSILAEPNGCFEQTTSSAWPNVLVTQYMKDTKQITPEIEMKAEALMSTGYQRLLTFEHQGGGFSWFGEQDPAPYLSVTAFGIMEFSDMAKVHEIDEAMLARTVQWIVGQQQADGSFKGDMSEFFSFHTSVVRNTAFTAWALATAGETGPAVQNALEYVKQNLGKDNDPYTLGIVANALAVGAPDDAALTEILAELDATKQKDDSGIHWDSGGTQTQFYANGDDATVSATALVTHAMLLDGYAPATVEGALKYITSKKDPNGNFGSTQATIWSLRTLLLSAKKGNAGAVGTFNVSVDGKAVQSVSLTKAQSDVMTRVDLSSLATVGSHDVSLLFTGTGKPSYNLVSSHHLAWADVPAEPKGPLSIDVAYDKTDLFVNDTVKASVTLQNNEASVQNMVLVTLGVAPGFSVNTDDLQKYLSDGSLSKFEMTARQLILYITKLDPNAKHVFEYSLQATMPVTAVDGGAEARMYYEPEKRTKAPAKTMKVKAQ